MTLDSLPTLLVAIAPILAQDDAQGGGILSLLIIIIPMGAILYLAIVPQRKARQRQAEMLRKLDVGDEIVTSGGIIGVITHAEDDLFHLEVDDDVVIRIAKSAVARSTAEPDPAERPPARSRKGLLGGGDSDAESGSSSSDSDGSDSKAS